MLGIQLHVGCQKTLDDQVTLLSIVAVLPRTSDLVCGGFKKSCICDELCWCNHTSGASTKMSAL